MGDDAALIPAPADPAKWADWRLELEQFRAKQISPEITAAYDRPEFLWARNNIVCGMVMMFDREFYDPASDTFKVDEFVARHRRDFGSLDALVLWQAYPRIGFDSRNQFDHYTLAPKLRKAVDQLHALGVKAYLAYNPWDTGTHRSSKPDPQAIAALVSEYDFDGIFLDTLREGDSALRNALDAVKPGVVMESELALPIGSMAANHASWAQWFDDSEAPGVMRNRWIERHHMMHLIRRWDQDHSGELQMAWMNGAGILVWENIFGSWNGWNNRDKAILRSMIPVRKRFADLFENGSWEPLVATTLDGVYASRWSQGSTSLWTLVNRTEHVAKGHALSVSTDGSTRLFDLIRGIEIDHGDLEIAARWIGAVLAISSSKVDEDFKQFLGEQAKRFIPYANPLARVLPIIQRTPAPKSTKRAVEGECVTLGPGPRKVVSRMWARECGDYCSAQVGGSSAVSVHYEKSFEHNVEIGFVAVQRHEVTNRQFLEFVERGYQPKHADSFLKHWVNRKPLEADLDKPVVFVDLEDARAYTKWAGLRLPTEIEWQLAMSEVPAFHNEIWNWTESEHSDGHTQFSILKGGCHWEAKGSGWYADSGQRSPDWSSKYLHFYPSLDRSETIGFRCAIDIR